LDCHFLFLLLQKLPQGAQVKIYIFIFKTEFAADPRDLLGLTHQGEPEPFDLFIRKASPVNPVKRLFFDDFVEKLDYGQHELGQAVFRFFMVEVQAPGRAPVAP
jgi:hypothetical protein